MQFFTVRGGPIDLCVLILAFHWAGVSFIVNHFYFKIFEEIYLVYEVVASIEYLVMKLENQSEEVTDDSDEVTLLHLIIVYSKLFKTFHKISSINPLFKTRIMNNKKRINFQEIAEQVDSLIDLVDDKKMINDYRTTDLLNLIEAEFETVVKIMSFT